MAKGFALALSTTAFDLLYSFAAHFLLVSDFEEQYDMPDPDVEVFYRPRTSQLR